MIVNYLVSYLITLFIMLFFDAIWLFSMIDRLYKKSIGHIMATDLVWPAALIFYLLYGFGITMFVAMPALQQQRGLGETFLYGALFGLVVLSPLFILVALIIKVCYGGPVIFKQQRVGYSGRIFTMWKFRTMTRGAENSLHQQYMSSLINCANEEGSAKAMTKLDSDLPVTGFGRMLRATSVDELPQLINILCGDMTLIGPRPPTIYEVENYLRWYCERFSTVPGMTGLWQVSGKNKLTFLEMIRLDIRYVRGLSLWLDIMILLKTPLVIVYDIADFLSSRRNQSELEGF